jgi:serine/threonine protein phosphatase PrpC
MDSGVIDKSGSCAICVLVVGEHCFVANVGDSRAVLSGEGGRRVFPLSIDHKPTEAIEVKRIKENGGYIYRTQSQLPRTSPDEQP